MLKAVRYGLYAQLLLGLGRMFGMVPNEALWTLHLVIGIAVAALAVVALGPLPQLADDKMRVVARYAPLVALATGLAMAGGLVGGGFVMMHMLLGIVTIGFVEMSAGRQRRALGDPRPS